MPGSGNSTVDRMQQQLAAAASSIFTLHDPVSRAVVRSGLEVMIESAGVLLRIMADEDRNIWQELQNKLQAFYVFEHVDSILGAIKDRRFSLSELVQAAALLDPYLSVWATEGLGHYYTELQDQQALLSDSLFRDSVADLPPWSIVPLHTGMGLSLAQSILVRAGSYQAAADLFLESCHHHSEEHYWGAAYEALGLVVYNLHPDWLLPVHSYLSQQSQDLLSYFWHGAGRAIYFSPLNFLPWSSAPWAGIAMCMNEPPTILAKRNALAGFSWAMTLVNIRHPEILALLLSHHGRNLPEPDAFINGVYSSAIVWCASMPRDDGYVDSLCRYKPPGSHACTPEAWDRFFGQPCYQALDDYQTVRSQKQIASLFRL